MEKNSFSYQLGAIYGGIRAVNVMLSRDNVKLGSFVLDGLYYDFLDYLSDETTTELSFSSNETELCLVISEDLNNALHSLMDGDIVYCKRLLERIDSEIFDYCS